MVKKIFASLFLIFFLVKPFVYLYAQTPTSDNLQKFQQDLSGDNFGAYFGPLGIPLPGVNCGVANSDAPLTQKCCNTEGVLKEKSGFDVILNNQGSDNILVAFMKTALTNTPLIGGLFSYWFGSFTDVQTKYKALKDFQQNNPGVACIYGQPDKAVTDPSCQCVASDPSSSNRTLAQMCYQYLSGSNELGSCVSCAGGGGMWTALGCIPTNVQGFISTFLLSTGIGLGGIIALICIIYAAFSIQISQGNPEKIKKAQELLTSCIMGLMLIIFSVFILRLIGVNILRIPFLQ